MVSESSSQLTGSLLPSFHRKFLPALGYQVGIISNESNACNSSDRAAEKLAFEEPRQVLHPLADTKKIRKAGSDQQVVLDCCEYNNVMRFLECDSLP
jgi:serine/threonine-protein kinase OSR1/STK39